jgi:hypothetical protein
VKKKRGISVKGRAQGKERNKRPKHTHKGRVDLGPRYMARTPEGGEGERKFKPK